MEKVITPKGKSKFRCPLCKGKEKKNKAACCLGCRVRVNRLLARGLSVEKIACGNAKAKAVVLEVKSEIDFGHLPLPTARYDLGQECVENSLGAFYYPVDLKPMRKGEIATVLS